MFKIILNRFFFISISFMAMWSTGAKAYTYKGYSGAWNTYSANWTLAGGQQPGSIAYIVGDFTIKTGALVCLNPGTKQRDVRSGVGGTSTIEQVSKEDELVFDNRGRFTLLQKVPTTVPDFEAFCESHQDQCLNGAQALFEETYAVSANDCKSGGNNWTPYEYLLGNHTATGTVYRDCQVGVPPSAETCANIDDNVTYFCTTSVSFRNYIKGTVLFSCIKQ